MAYIETVRCMSIGQYVMEPFHNPQVEAVFNLYSGQLKTSLLRLRQMIFDTAAMTEGVGPLEETLKWGQPSYLTPQSQSGTTIRIDQIKSKPGHYGMFVHCQTSLMAMYREIHPDVLTYEGKRCIDFDCDQDPPEDVVRHCIALALTYHLKGGHERLAFA